MRRALFATNAQGGPGVMQAPLDEDFLLSRGDSSYAARGGARIRIYYVGHLLRFGLLRATCVQKGARFRLSRRFGFFLRGF